MLKRSRLSRKNVQFNYIYKISQSKHKWYFLENTSKKSSWPLLGVLQRQSLERIPAKNIQSSKIKGRSCIHSLSRYKGFGCCQNLAGKDEDFEVVFYSIVRLKNRLFYSFQSSRSLVAINDNKCTNITNSYFLFEFSRFRNAHFASFEFLTRKEFLAIVAYLVLSLY